MKVEALCLLIRGRKIVSQIKGGDVVLPGGSVEESKAQEQLSKLVLEQCGLVTTKPVLIADIKSEGK